MKRSKVYLRAAEIMDDKAHPHHACHAIAKSINGRSTGDFNCGDLGLEYDRRKKEFDFWFKPETAPLWYWPKSDRGVRVIALCFMAAIADS